MSRKSLIGALVTIGSSLALSPAMAQESVRIGTSGSGSVYYTLGVGLSRMLQEHVGLNSSVETVGGSHANVFALLNDQVDIALVNAQAASDGHQGVAPFPSEVDVCLIAQGQPTLRQVLVRRASGIEEPQDLAGKVWITDMSPNPDIAHISAALMEVTGLSESDVNKVTMVESSEAITGFETGTIDAATLPASAGAPHVARLMESETIDFLYLTPETVAKMEPSLPRGVQLFELPADTYPNQQGPVQVFGIPTYLAANCELSDDLVYQITAALLDNTEEFAQYHPTGREYNIETTVQSPVIPYHPGTVRYLKEKGAWTDELEQHQAAE